MGATDDYRIYETDNKKVIEKKFLAECEDARYEDGNSYPGTIAAFSSIGEWLDTPRASASKAQDRVIRDHDKWGPARAVAYYLPSKVTETQKRRAKKAKATYEAADKATRDLGKKLRSEWINAKSKTAGCTCCGSSYPRALLAKNRSNLSCALCGTSLLSATSLKRVAVAKAKAEKAKVAWQALAKAKPSKKIGYVVGGMCPS